VKEIKAILQPFKVAAVTDALQAIPGVGGITALEARGFGHQRGMYGLETPAKGAVNYTEKVLMILVVHDEAVDSVLSVIRDQAHTGNFGDGKVFVATVDDALRIRTGERGEGAI
jgi:nitrogen regulatory protein P-II 1